MKFLAWHLGVGDAIICAGLVVKLAEREGHLIVPAYHKNYNTIKSFFSNFANIEVKSVTGDSDVEHFANTVPSIRLGCYIRKRDVDKGDMSFSELFYDDARIEYEERYKSCPLYESSRNIVQVSSENDIFVSNKGSAGVFPLRNVSENCLMPDDSTTMLAYCDAIINAREVHCIESSFLQLVEQLPTQGKLFYHKYARPNSNGFKFRKEWTVLEA